MKHDNDDVSPIAARMCSRCGTTKPSSEFHKSSTAKDGLCSHCKSCERERKAKYRSENKEKIRAQGQAQYAANPEKRRDSHRRWAKRNPEKLKEIKRRYRQSAKGKVEANIRGYIHKTIKKGYKYKPTFEALGYTPGELIQHLEKRFLPGMTWDNYGEWHIDHIIPLSAFNYSTTKHIDFKRAWALSNLQPLWAADNIRKHARLVGAFQASLALDLPDNDNKEATNDCAA